MGLIHCHKIGIPIKEICYYLFFGFLLFAKGIGLYDGQASFKVFLLAAMICYCSKMIMTSYTNREFLIIALLWLLGIVSYWKTREKGILFCIMIVTGMKDVPIKRVWKLALIVFGFSFIPTVILTTLGIVSSPFRVHVRPVVGFVIRWGLGMAHPNVAHISYLVFTALVIGWLKEKLSFKVMTALFLGNLYIYFYSVSNTGLLMTTFLIMAAVYLKLRKNPSRLEYGLVECVFPACLLMSLLFPLILSGKVFEIVNKIMNTRLMQSKRYLTQEKITLFGTQLGLNNAVNTIDNSYLFAFMTYGIIIFILWAVGYLFLIRRLVKQRRKWDLAIVVALLIAGVSEPFLFNTSFKNISLLFLGEQLFSYTESKEKEGSILFDVTRQAILPLLTVQKQGLMALIGKYRVTLVVISVSAGILWAAAYGSFVEKIDAIWVPRQVCDSVDQESVYISPGLSGDGNLVMGYIDEKTEMVSFDGILIQAEYIRGIVCRAVYGSGLGFIIVLFVCFMLEYNNSSRLRSSSNEKRRKSL